MSYTVKYQDIGLKDYKEVWDYQLSVFNLLSCSKKSNSGETNGGYETPPGTLIFVEHPHVFTLGKHGSANNLLIDSLQLKAKGASFYHIDRGGDITYHGPGQIVGYPIFDLEIIGISLKEYIFRLEEAVIRTIEAYGLKGERLNGATGVWLDTGIPGSSRKICAIGVKASRYITMHGFAFNVNSRLEYFNYINPCGFTDKAVTSLEKETGREQNIEEVKTLLREKIGDLFDLKFIS